MNYEECVEYLYNLNRSSSNSTLEDTKRRLDMVFHDRSARIIHVAGTNGKGSVCAFTDSILRTSNIKTGLFTSPHLIKINERIKVDGIDIPDDDFTECFNYVDSLIKKEDAYSCPSFFEYVFLIAMKYFSLKKVEAIVLETGLGGRLDMTNTVSSKDVTVITKIGLDHMEFLGDSIRSIAKEKAGIIKSGVPVVFFNNNDESEEVILNEAKAQNSEYFPISDKDIHINSIDKEGIAFSVVNEYYRYDSLKIGLLGRYQTGNASLAIMAVKLLKDDRITDETIERGLLSTKWAGRMEEIKPNVYVDGAHNIDGIAAFLKAVASLPHRGRLSLLFSVVADKNYSSMVSLINESGLFSHVYVCHIQNKRALDMDELKRTFSHYPSLEVSFYEDVMDGYNAALKSLSGSDELYVAGSLYLVGQLKAEIN